VTQRFRDLRELRRRVTRRLGRVRPHDARNQARDERGFTLIELLITALILPLIMGAIAAGLIAVLSIQGSVSNRVSDSGDAQLTSANFVQDVQSASLITTDASATQCGPGTQLLGLQWTSGGSTQVVTYAKIANGTGWLLVRQQCASGSLASPTERTTVSYDIPSNLAAPTLQSSDPVETTVIDTQAAQGWISVQPVTEVTFPILEPLSGYSFSLTAVPAASAPPSTAGSPIVNPTNTSCGFAATEGGTVNNGTYAQTLCFVDFAAYNTPANAALAQAPGCLEMVASIPGGDVLSFCMSESGNQPMVAASLPTYPQAFLGNTLPINGVSQPFYTGLGCPDTTPPETSSGAPTPSCISPAMYQTNTGYGPTNTLNFTNINVTTATGAPATGWYFVSADAETTDVSESIVWQSSQPLSLLNNTPSSPYGNTCNNMNNWNGPNGVGTTQVTCAASSAETSSIKTGTPMVEALSPTSMTITMKGAGLEGVAVGLLLS
jgi:prepilin-type N-terminal cleavage/methylation domain-containing protein